MLKITKCWWEEVKENAGKLRDILCSWSGRLNIMKMSVLSKLIYKFKVIDIKISAKYFVDRDKIMLKYILKNKGTANTVFKIKNKLGGITNINSYYIATVSKTVWDWQMDKHRLMEENGESTNSLTKYSQIVFGKGTKVFQERRDSLFNKWLQLHIYRQQK